MRLFYQRKNIKGNIEDQTWKTESCNTCLHQILKDIMMTTVHSKIAHKPPYKIISILHGQYSYCTNLVWFDNHIRQTLFGRNITASRKKCNLNISINDRNDMQIIIESSPEKMKRKCILTTTNHTLTFQRGVLCKIAANTICMGSLCGFWIALPTASSWQSKLMSCTSPALSRIYGPCNKRDEFRAAVKNTYTKHYTLIFSMIFF